MFCCFRPRDVSSRFAPSLSPIFLTDDSSQVEYAMEAVKQGSTTVGAKSKDFVVLASLKRSTNELGSYQQKVFRIDDNIGVAVSGLISDARVLCEFMRNECLNHRYVYGTGMQSGRLVTMISDKSQQFTQSSGKRPYGVGLLVAGVDKTGTHLYQTEPSGVHFEYKAQAIGARSQAARTYLEKNFESFETSSLDDLIQHVLIALKSSSQKKLTSRNVSIGIVGLDRKFTVLEGDDVRPYVAAATQQDDEDEPEEEKPDYLKTREEKQREAEAKAAIDASNAASSSEMGDE